MRGNLSIDPISRRIVVQLENGNGCVSRNIDGVTMIERTYLAWCGTCDQETQHIGVRCKECRR